MTVMSIDRGPTDAELIDETIGVNLRRTAQRLPDHEAFVVAHQGIRQTWAEFDATIDAVATLCVVHDISLYLRSCRR